MRRRDYGAKLSRRGGLRFCFCAEDSKADTCSNKQDRKGHWHFYRFLSRNVRLHVAELGNLFSGIVRETRMNETDDSGQHQENAQHENEALHEQKPYHRWGTEGYGELLMPMARSTLCGGG